MMRRNVGAGRGWPDAQDASNPSNLLKRSNSPPHHRHANQFQRKHAVILTAVFFAVVYLARAWRGALRSAQQQQLDPAKTAVVPLSKGLSKTSDTWRGAHQSLNYKMDESASV